MNDLGDPGYDAVQESSELVFRADALPPMPLSADDPASIFDYPPPDLVDLRDALREETRQPTNYWHSLVLSAASESYCRMVREHYDREHGSGGEECTCA